MVQSARLKRNIHPLVPIISILLLVSLFLFIYSKPLAEKLINSYGSYKNERNSLIEQYNQYNNDLSQILTQPYNKVSQYRTNLTKALAINNQSRNILAKIKQLDSKNIEKYISVKASADENLDKISKNELITSLINNKISAIDVYQNILNFDDCLRSASSDVDIIECKSIYNGIKSPANINNEYRVIASKLLSNFTNYTKTQRTNMINKLVPYHNKMINTLEVIINSPITL